VTPEVELVGLDVRGSGVDGQQFALTLLVSNPNSEPIPVAEIRYSVRLAGEGYLNGRSTTPIVLAAAGRQTVRIELASDSVSSGSRLLALARGPANTLAYILTGDLVLTGRPPRLLPFTYSGDVPLTIAAGD
jgi:LEA14-like dessication related protein